MSIHIAPNWWQNFYETIKCLILRSEIWLLLYDESDVLEKGQTAKLINWEKYRHPGKSESWYLEKVTCDLRKKILT